MSENYYVPVRGGYFSRWGSIQSPILVPMCLALLLGCEAPQVPTVVQSQRAALLGSTSDPAVVGRWDPVTIEGQIPAVSMALLHDGRIAYWSGIDAVEEHDHHDLDYVLETQFLLGHIHDASTRVLSLAGGTPHIMTPEHPLGAREGDLFCSGHTILPDGRVLDVGGTKWVTVDEDRDINILYGLNHAQYFDPSVSDWVATTDMHHGRWYPSILTLPNGNVAVFSGLLAATTTTMQTAIERFDVATETWTHIGDRSLPMYARLTVVPSGPFKGRIFYSTSGQLWGPSGWAPDDFTWNLQQVCDWTNGTCEFLGPSVFGVRQHGVSVLLPLDATDNYRARILTFSGTLNRSTIASSASEVADLSYNPPLNLPTTPMTYPRWMANGTLLPDGTVLATGGAIYDTVMAWGQPSQWVMHTELFDPKSNTWRVVAPMRVPRAYHSTTLLLPDGRVLSGGTATLPFPSRFVREHVPGEEQVLETRFEFYEPPYLFRGERPVIRGAPQHVRVGQTFSVETSYPGKIDSVVLVRPGATTHGYDADQRMIRLSFTETAPGQLKVTAPPDTSIAPAGYYMLFVNGHTAAGPVPSVARFVRLLPTGS